MLWLQERGQRAVQVQKCKFEVYVMHCAIVVESAMKTNKVC